MCETLTYSNECIHTLARVNDPTRTLTLRNTFVRDMNRRFAGLRGVVRRAIINQDVFGLRNSPNTFQYSVPPKEAFNFPRSADKVEAFMEWFNQQVNKEILEVVEIQQIGRPIEEAWTNKYILDSYKRGVQRARHELVQAGFDVPSLANTGGIEISMSTPFHIDRVGLLYTRTFNELKGITTAMDTQISRVLAQGIADGDGPALLARKLTKTISGPVGDLGLTDTLGRFIPAERRAVIMARTEIIRAHHQAMVQEYRNWEVEQVKVKAEWKTAGDNRVCPICEPLEGEIFTLDEIMNMIPAHPQCRCIALPFKSEE